MRLLYFAAPAVRTIAGYKPAMQVRFGLIPAVGYLFDYLTRIYTDLLAQGTPAAVEFMPFVCCVAYLAFVLRSSAENETRLRLEQTQENLHLQVTQATRDRLPAGAGGGAPFYPGGGDGSVRAAVQRAGKRPACLPAAASDG